MFITPVSTLASRNNARGFLLTASSRGGGVPIGIGISISVSGCRDSALGEFLGGEKKYMSSNMYPMMKEVL